MLYYRTCIRGVRVRWSTLEHVLEGLGLDGLEHVLEGLGLDVILQNMY